MTEQEIQYQQISMLDDKSLISLYGTAAKVLTDRNMFATSKSILHKIIKEKRNRDSVVNCYTPKEYTNRGKVKRMESYSVLLDFLDEDWSYLFTGIYDEAKIYYVYYHSNIKHGTCRFKKGDKTTSFNGRPFYIGKGTGNRYKNKKRSRAHISIINELKDAGYDEDNIFHIYKDKLTEKEALELEAKLITFFGCSGELNQKKAHFHGTKGGWLINSDPSVRPHDVESMMRIRGRE